MYDLFNDALCKIVVAITLILLHNLHFAPKNNEHNDLITNCILQHNIGYISHHFYSASA